VPHRRTLAKVRFWLSTSSTSPDSLFEDPSSPGALPGFEYHAHAFGPVDLVFLDNRSGSTFMPDEMFPYLGTPQRDRLREDLDDWRAARQKPSACHTNVR